ncbi:methylmalonyl-CoA mutase subunit beta [Galbibacter sp. EGI 63066]|uniref:methylmalonyl-CoA mutase subunit beta n=1 Tax=Galbibacter sp. EGI 63066 TaxID=2993559 RepID=UPI0022491773|nr:methylmalonyl-CoA mutase subunit beta [Galbibacter sp. EGI 63066]MCX2680702.1 methylmalonyl-CoA mutase subunit beta [Galbibacter sp. EGI 63066]
MKHSLFSEFQEIPAKQWKQKIQSELEGADYNETLVTKTPEGINIKPFYSAEDLKDSLAPTPVASWNICEKIYAGNALVANKKALQAVGKGAESILFTIPKEDIQLDALFDDFPFETIAIHIEPHFLSVGFTEKLIHFFSDTKADIHYHLDIVGHLARSGNWYFNMKKDIDVFCQLQKLLAKASEFKTTTTIETSLYQNAGADIVQQLAYAMAHANEYLNLSGGNPVSFCFKTAIGSNYFFEIAKLKALRLLWKTLAGEYNIENDCQLFCTSTKRNKTLYDYNVNMLRTTTESMSAVLGGANTICTLPYDAIYHKDNEFGSRIARNQLLILKHESYFDKVQNPTDGAYYIESLIKELAEKALTLFKQIEAGGGFLSQLKDHIIQKKIKETAASEQKGFHANEKILVGTNKYQNPTDRMENELELYPFVKTEARKTLLEPIIESRLAESVEQKRLKDEHPPS